VFDQIRAATTRVADIREEVRQLACDWSFSARTRVLREALLRKLRLCRSGFEDVWGSHDGLWDEEIQEMDDYIGARTTNMIWERAEKTNTSWIRVFRDTFKPQAANGSTPGEANRAEAAALAWTSQVAVGNSQILTQDLLVRQSTRTLERFDGKKAADLSYYAYRGLTTLGGGGWPPPLEGGDRP